MATGVYFPDRGGGSVAGDRLATFRLKDGMELVGGFRGDELSPDSRSADTLPSVLSGEIGDNWNVMDNSYHVVTGESVGASAVLDGFTIQSGYANGSSSELDGIRHRVAGGLFLSAASPVIRRCRFENNFASDFGGANYNYNGSVPWFTDCVFTGNTGRRGGGAVYNRFSPARYENCIFFKNAAPATYANGGAVTCDNSRGSFINCTFTQNSAQSGSGAVHANSSLLSISNCIIWGNLPKPSPSFPNHSISHSLIQWLPGTDTDNPPLFVNVESGDLRVLKGSPTIDAGSNAATGLTFDISGNPRIVNGLIDMGAHEGGVDASFQLLYPGLDLHADSNGNGIGNLSEYALGADPRQMGPSLPVPAYNAGILSLHFRENDPDLIVTFQKSATLQQASWVNLEASDYSVNDSTSKRGVRHQNLKLADTSSRVPSMFYRIHFSLPMDE